MVPTKRRLHPPFDVFIHLATGNMAKLFYVEHTLSIGRPIEIFVGGGECEVQLAGKIFFGFFKISNMTTVKNR